MPLPAAARRFDAIVFDLDGVIIDSERISHELWTRRFAEFGASFSRSEWGARVGSYGPERFDPYAALAERARTPLPSRAQLFAEIRDEASRLIDAAGPLPGVREWVDSALDLGLALAIATSAPRTWLDARLAATGLASKFAVTCTPDEGHEQKPDPALYLAACEQLGIAPTRAVAIEDSPAGVLAARRADMCVVVVPGTVTAWMDLSSAHHRMDSLLDLECAAALDLLGKW